MVTLCAGGMAKEQCSAGSVAQCGGPAGLPPCVGTQSSRPPAGITSGQQQTRYDCLLLVSAHAACCLMHASTVEDSKVNNRHTQVMQGVCLKCQEYSSTAAGIVFLMSTESLRVAVLQIASTTHRLLMQQVHMLQVLGCCLVRAQDQVSWH